MALANRVREASTAEGRVVEEVASQTPAPGLENILTNSCLGLLSGET
jgi:hypothetical protein